MKVFNEQFIAASDRIFVKIGKFVGCVLPFLLIYGGMIYLGVKFARSTDTLTAVKIGLLLTWILHLWPTPIPSKTFRIGNWKITLGPAKE